MNSPTPRSGPLERHFGIDLRALAALRIGLAGFVLFDLLGRVSALRAHYTDAGVLPRTDLLTAFDWLLEWPLCLHLVSGSTAGQGLLFLLHALAAVALLFGYRSRLACFVVWLLTSSLQLRNLFLGGGFDALLRLLLFWGMFLPLGARASLAAPGKPEAGERLHVSLAGIALLLQITGVYFAAGWAKAETSYWLEGEALGLILGDDFFATGIGHWLAGMPVLCRWLGYLVLAAELAGPPLLLLCCGSLSFLRIGLIAGFWIMNAGFGLTLAVGPFPWLAGLALAVFLPPSAWDALAGSQALHGLRSQLQPALAPVQPWLPTPTPRPVAAPFFWLRDALVAACLVWTLVWNVGLMRNPEFDMPLSVRWFGNGLFLQQNWRMFATPPTRTGWLVLPGRLVDGSEVDLLAAGGPVPGDEAIASVAWDKPADLLGRSAGLRWRILLHRVLKGDNREHAPLHFGRFLCREWNRTHSEGRQLATFEVVGMITDLTLPAATRRYLPETIWRHDCFG